jgi:hypothetical protein
MSTITALFALIAVGAASGATPPTAENVTQSELKQIETAIRHYFRGGDEGDHTDFRRAFHPDAQVRFVEDGRFGSWSLDQYIARFTPGQKAERQTRILMIDVAGTTAIAKVEARDDTFRFLDYLSLLKMEGQWRIVHKIFEREEI